MINHLPLYDIPMLVSTINCLLRDREFEDLDDICQYYDVSKDEVEKILASGGFEYDKGHNSVR